MAWLSNEKKIAKIIETAMEAGRLFRVRLPAELTGQSKKAIFEDSQDGFSVYYGYYGGQWSLVGVGPVGVFGRGPIKKKIWNSKAKAPPAWTPLDDREKPKRLSDCVPVGGLAVGKMSDQTYILARVTSVDSEGRVTDALAADGIIRQTSPEFWMRAYREAAAASYFAQGRAVFHSFDSFTGSMYQRDKALAAGKEIPSNHTPVSGVETATPVETAARSAPPFAPDPRDPGTDYVVAAEAGDEDGMSEALTWIRRAARDKEVARLRVESPGIQDKELRDKSRACAVAVEAAFLATIESPFATE